MTNDKVIIAMSGGVDSSVAAAILKKEGQSLIGITMRVWEDPAGTEKRHGACCSLDDADDARRVAEKLNIPHYVMNVKKEFKKNVVDYFVGEYLSGRTPNPCILCNSDIKFDYLFLQGEKLGAKYVATGHYAKTGKFHDFPVIIRGADRVKDQSYFLFSIKPDKVPRILFPLADLDKEKTRAIAKELGLNVAQKQESQEICFIPDDDYAGFIKQEVDSRAIAGGDIVNRAGEKLGRHKGLFNYTIGQRKGLGIAHKTPLYVVSIEPSTNRLVVGEKDEAYGKTLLAKKMNWFVPPEDFSKLELSARIRHRHEDANADVTVKDNGETIVEFAKPELAITPGQAVVIYHGDVVIGGGWIEKKLG